LHDPAVEQVHKSIRMPGVTRVVLHYADKRVHGVRDLVRSL
jgi:hypothetical protein